MKKLDVGHRLYLSVLLIFLVFAGLFIVFQQRREKEYRVEQLNTRLQDYNVRLHESWSGLGDSIEAPLSAYISDHPLTNLRLTIVRSDGVVLFDNLRKDYNALPNHLGRKEIGQAKRDGWGYDINRLSSTMNVDYFYSATWFPADSVFIRSALPYTSDLVEQLRADQHYLWFALGAVLLLLIVLYPFARQLNINFLQLHHTLEETRGEQDKLKRELTQNVAHELKTPVASIQGYLETIIENPNIDEPTRQQFLNRCYAQSRRLSALLQDIQTLHRMDDAPQEQHLEDVDVLSVVRGIEKETALQFEKREMTFLIDANNESSVVIRGTQMLVYGIFRNLVDNALAYAGKGTTVNLTFRRGENAWEIEFADNGVGVPEEHLPRLFERFYRVDKGRSRANGGTGLGLAIVKNAVIKLGGTISVANKEGGGLKFLIRFED